MHMRYQVSIIIIITICIVVPLSATLQSDWFSGVEQFLMFYPWLYDVKYEDNIPSNYLEKGLVLIRFSIEILTFRTKISQLTLLCGDDKPFVQPRVVRH